MNVTNTTPNPQFVAIANALGFTLSHCVDRDNQNIDQQRTWMVTPEGNKIFVRTGGYHLKDKIHFSPSFPDHIVDESMVMRGTHQGAFMPYGTPVFDGIKVGVTKSAEQIAKDVQRRFMPTAEILWTKAGEFCEKQKAYYSTKATFKTEVETLLKPFGYNRETGITRASISYIGGDYAHIKLESLNIDNVRKLAEFLKTL